jgi:hypothetical protein
MKMVMMGTMRAMLRCLPAPSNSPPLPSLSIRAFRAREVTANHRLSSTICPAALPV